MAVEFLMMAQPRGEESGCGPARLCCAEGSQDNSRRSRSPLSRWRGGASQAQERATGRMEEGGLFHVPAGEGQK